MMAHCTLDLAIEPLILPKVTFNWFKLLVFGFNKTLDQDRRFVPATETKRNFKEQLVGMEGDVEWT